MSLNQDITDSFEKIRRNAEGLVQKHTECNFDLRSDIEELIQELKIHQSELELQKEELKLSQQEISLLHQKYFEIYEFAPCGYLTLDTYGFIQHINLTGITMLGIDRGNIGNQTVFSNYISFPWKDHFREALHSSAKNNEKKSIDIKLDLKDGATKWVRMIVKPEQNNRSSVFQWQMILMDITDRKQAEQALQQSENYYRLIFETSGSAMCIIEEDTTISHVNNNFAALTGYSQQDIEWKKSWLDFVHLEDQAWMKEYHYLQIGEPRTVPLNYEFRFLHRNGEIRNGYLGMDIIPGTTKTVVSLVDIT